MYEFYWFEDCVDGFVLQVMVWDIWQILYEFIIQICLQIDLKVVSWYVLIYLVLKFVMRLIVVVIIDDVWWNLFGCDFVVYCVGGIEKICFVDVVVVVDILSEWFGINVVDIGECGVFEMCIDELLVWQLGVDVL